MLRRPYEVVRRCKGSDAVSSLRGCSLYAKALYPVGTWKAGEFKGLEVQVGVWPCRARQPGDFHVTCCQPQHLDVCSTDSMNSSATRSQLKTLAEFREEKFKTKQFKTKHLRFLIFGILTFSKRKLFVCRGFNNFPAFGKNTRRKRARFEATKNPKMRCTN